MSRRDLMRQRHRMVSPRASTVEDAVGVVPDTKRLDIPQPGAQNFEQRVRESLMVYLGRQGDPLDRGITLRDLIDAGVVSIAPGYELGPGGGAIPIAPGGGGAASNIKPDLTPPPQVTGFRATPSLTNIFLETDPPTFAAGHGYFVTNIYGAQQAAGQPPPTFDKAVQITSFTGDVGSWATSPNTTWFLWAKWKTRDGVESISPAGGTNGVSVTTGQDVDKLVAAMTGPGEPFKVVTVQTTLPDGSVVPPGTYTADAYIHNGFIKTAQIANLAVDDAKIKELTATKIRTGTLTAGNSIGSPDFQSGVRGWIISSDAQGRGSAEFQNVRIRGELMGATGTFSGQLVAATGTFAGDVTAAAGNFNGGVRNGSFQVNGNWPPNGQAGFWLGHNPGVQWGLRLGNKNDGRWFEVDGSGNLTAPNFSIINGQVTINGTITMDNGGATKLRITPSTIEVYENGLLRVRMGIWA